MPKYGLIFILYQKWLTSNSYYVRIVVKLEKEQRMRTVYFNTSSDANSFLRRHCPKNIVVSRQDRIFHTHNKEEHSFKIVWHDQYNIEVSISNIESNLKCLFSYLQNLKTIDFVNFDGAGIKNMNFFFERSENLTTVDMSNIELRDVESMAAFFKCCTHLKKISLPKTSEKLRNIYDMFKCCRNLESLDITRLDWTNLYSYLGAFDEIGNEDNPVQELDLSTVNITAGTGSYAGEILRFSFSYIKNLKMPSFIPDGCFIDLYDCKAEIIDFQNTKFASNYKSLISDWNKEMNVLPITTIETSLLSNARILVNKDNAETVASVCEMKI